jgi:hypothetical protein
MKPRKMFTILLVAVGLMVCQAEFAKAAPMGTAWTYQGRLLDANEVADGLYDFEFSLYDDPCTGSQQGSTLDINDIDVIDGYFTVVLDFGAEFDGDARWLEIAVRPGVSIDAYDTLIPRQETTPTPYAIYAQTAGGDGDWTVSGNDMYSIPSGKIGIGTSTPEAELSIQMPGKASPTIGFNAPGLFIKGGDWNEGYQLEVQSSSGNTRFLVDSAGRVGIGTSSPQGKLEVSHDGAAHDLVVNPSTGNVGIGTTSPQGKLEVSHDGAAHDLVVNTSTGNVGIGTTTPNAKLTVNGAILRDGSLMYGSESATHINLGSSSKTGKSGENYSWSTVGGGRMNTASGNQATVGGGDNNTASGRWSTVGGGRENTASAGASDGGTFVGGGFSNSASGRYSTVGGGYDNTASGGVTSGGGATVGGGYYNTATGMQSTIGGGTYNDASDSYTTVGGGQRNTASDFVTTVGGGQDNTASNQFATVPGGQNNSAGGYYSFAAGRRAKVRDDAASSDFDGDEGTFVWADSTDADFQSTGPDQFLIRASGGVGIGTNSPGAMLDVNGYIQTHDNLPFSVKRFTGTLDVTGTKTVPHGIANGHQKILTVQAWHKGAGGSMIKINAASVDSNNIYLTGGSGFNLYRVTILYSSSAHTW